MDILEKLLMCFHKQPSYISERNRMVEIDLKCFGADIPRTDDEILSVINQFPQRDEVLIIISTITQERYCFSNCDKAYDITFEDFLSYVQNEDEISIKITIEKKIQDNIISVYRFQNFTEVILNKNLVESLEMFNNLLKGQEYLIFELFDATSYFSTNTIIFKHVGEKLHNNFQRLSKIEACKKASCFYNISEYELVPDDFNLVVNYEGNPLTERFSSLRTVLSLIYLSNTAYITNNTLNLHISGQRNLTANYNLTDNQKKMLNHELFSIYNWIYTDGNPVDKAIIARNIISLHCRYTDLVETDEKTYASIQSNYAVYQKNNVSQYLELKNKLADHIVDIVSKSSDVIIGLFDRIKNNVFIFFSFLATVFLTKISSSKLQNIFSADITLLTYLILLGSLGFIWLSNKEVEYKIKSLKEGYIALKNNYIELLDERDLQDIFNNDSVFNKNIHEIQQTKSKIINAWIAFVFISFVVVESLSSSPLIAPLISGIIQFLQKIIK